MSRLVFLLDVDNTLIDNDRVKDDLQAHIERLVGPEHNARFWGLYEEIRQELDYVDIPLTLERYRVAIPDEPRFGKVASALLCYPYEQRLYPGALEAIAHIRTFGRAAILSDGDPVFQPAKVARAGIADAVDDNVFVYVHKEQHLEEVMRALPADRYVLVDDKPRVLAVSKALLPDERLVTLHVCQGKYAHAAEHESFPDADFTIDAIAELHRFGPRDFAA